MNPNDFVGMTADVTPNKDDCFNEFRGTIIGVKDGFFQVKDQDDDVWDVEENQIKYTIGLDLAE